uniref:G protein-coupled receptor n=1 Tax=Panagrellus redivivus TaxID=6233 RepID=A0A7E4VIE0_PANRE
MSATVTQDDFIPYSNFMHINTFLVSSIGAFTFYLILFHSTKEMSYYKYYMLSFTFSAIIFDLHVSFIFSPLPIFPLPALCCTSVFFINSTWRQEIVNFVIMHFFLSYLGISILIILLYRYQSLKGNLSFFHSKRGVIILALWIILYPLPSVISLYFALGGEEETLAYVKANYPETYDLYANHACYTLINPVGMTVYATTAACEILFVCIVGPYGVFKVYRLLYEKKIKFSAKTYELHRQLIHSLVVLAVVHAFFLAVPTITAFIMIINSFGNLREKYSVKSISLFILISNDGSVTIENVKDGVEEPQIKNALKKWADKVVIK